MGVLPRARSKAKKARSNVKNSHSHRSFESIMTDTTRAMPRSKRYFSVFIHSRSVWTVGDLLGKTIARPNAILFGSITSFVITVGVYLLSKNYGYSLSGSESISAFLVGWVIGIVFDFVSSLFKKK